MKSKNYAALILLVFVFGAIDFCAATVRSLALWSRFAASEALDVKTTAMLTSAATCFGYLVGGGLSLAVRRRFVLLGVAVWAAVAVGTGFGSLLAGVCLMMFARAWLVPLSLRTGAEEVDAVGRPAKVALVTSALVLTRELTGQLGTLFAGASRGSVNLRSGNSLDGAYPTLVALLVLLAIVCVLAGLIAGVFPGRAFDFNDLPLAEAKSEVHNTHNPPAQNEQAYRGGAQLSPAASPKQAPGLTALAIAAMILMQLGTTAQMQQRGSAFFPSAWLDMLASIAGVLMLVFFAGILVVSEAKLSLSWPLAGGLVIVAIGHALGALAGFVESPVLGKLGILALMCGEGLGYASGLAIVFSSLNTRWAGGASALSSLVCLLGSSIIGYLFDAFHKMFGARFYGPVMLAFVVLALVAAIATVLIGPKVDRTVQTS
jgi:hypothetical protein